MALDIKIGRGILFGIIIGVGCLYGKHKCHKRNEFPNHAHAMFRDPHMFRNGHGKGYINLDSKHLKEYDE